MAIKANIVGRVTSALVLGVLIIGTEVHGDSVKDASANESFSAFTVSGAGGTLA